MSIEVFDFGGHRVRTAGTHETPLFCALDVCGVLGYEQPSKAYKRLDQDECETVPLQGPSSINNAVFVNESGLYTLILGSKKPEAKAFKKWVTSEVLPAIRRKGYYSAIEADQERETERLLAQCFPKLPGPSVPIFRPLIAALVRLRRKHEPENPAWARMLAQWVYGWAIRLEGQQPRRRTLNPRPNGSKTDHSMFSDVAMESVRHVVNVGVFCASNGFSSTWEDWKLKMELHFGTKSVQLPMMVSLAQLPEREGAAE